VIPLTEEDRVGVGVFVDVTLGVIPVSELVPVGVGVFVDVTLGVGVFVEVTVGVGVTPLIHVPHPVNGPDKTVPELSY
jgi:hypothetical protein